MSFSPDGQIHYYASPGVDDLTADDYLASYFPYGNRCLTFNNFFFNVANWDNGAVVVHRMDHRRSADFRDPAAGAIGCTASPQPGKDEQRPSDGVSGAGLGQR